MKSSKQSSDKSKTSKTGSKTIKKSQSTEGLNVKNSAKGGSGKNGKTKKSVKLAGVSEKVNEWNDAEFASGDDEFGAIFEKFWKTVTDGMDKQSFESVPRSAPVNNKITEIQKRIRLNQEILKRTGDRMRGISFASERENLSQWKEGLTFRNPSRDDLNRFKDVNALDLEIEKLKDGKPDRNVFLRSSPGIVNFHQTMESTLNILDKIQKGDDVDRFDTPYREIKSELNVDFIKTPNLVTISDEE